MKESQITTTESLPKLIPTYTLDGLTFEVLIMEQKTAYGRPIVKITPLNGSGTKWVNLSKITHK